MGHIWLVHWTKGVKSFLPELEVESAVGTLVEPEGRQGDTTSRRLLSQELRISANDFPCHCNLSSSSFVLHNEFGWSHGFSGPARISRSRSFQGEVFRQPDSFVSRPSLTNANLERAHRSFWILDPRVKYSASAAICNLLVVRSTGHQIHDCRVLLTTMRDIHFEFRTISLLGGLTSNHVPYNFFLCPCPTQSPSGCLDMTIPLEVVYRDHSLLIHIENTIHQTIAKNLHR
nr:hypothetical protein Iba_chr03bCG7180 [Ipomoea batatas]